MKRVRTRYAPSPTGFMQIGNLRTALYEYLIAKHSGGSFILRIEDTDQERYVEGAVDFIYKTLAMTGIVHDEGPDIGGEYGPYVQSERKPLYLPYAKELVEKGHAYYCFCSKERLDGMKSTASDSKDFAKYDRHCLSLTREEVKSKLDNGEPFVIRQLIPEGSTSFDDEVFGQITIQNEEIEDQILIKSDGMPTYNFANVIDDHLMNITHVVRGCEYLTSTPKYTLLYDSLGWEKPIYVHLPLLCNSDGKKLSKRNGDASFVELVEQGFLPDAIINFVALLGWSPPEEAGNNEIFSLSELETLFEAKRISKSPSIADINKLKWMNGEYIKRLDPQVFFELALPYLKQAVQKETNYKKIAGWVQPRVELMKDSGELVAFIGELPVYAVDLYIHKKMKTDTVNSLFALEKAYNSLQTVSDIDWNEENIHNLLMTLISELEIKNGQMLWPVRTALSGQPSSPCGAMELAEILGKTESLRRIEYGIDLLKKV